MENRKPKVPQVIADWFEEHNHYGISDMIRLAQDVDYLDEDIYKAFLYLTEHSLTYYYDDMVAVVVVMMDFFGYEVQEWN